MSVRFLFGWLVLAAAVLTAIPAAARPVPMRIGVRAGVNAATLDCSGELAGQDVDGRLGLSGGLWVRLGPARGLALQAEALYTQKGARLNDVILEGLFLFGWPEIADFTFDLDYLEVPLLARLGVPVGRATVCLVAGPSFATKLRARSRLQFPGEPAREYEQTKLKSNDIGLAIGAGIEVGRVLVEARWSRSLTHIFRYPSYERGEHPLADIRNQVLTGSVGIAW